MAHPKAVALGEIGLDYHYDLSPRDVQKDVFARQLALAKRLNKPVIIHIREAHGDAMDILRTADRPAGVLHCYTGSWESAKAYLDMGFYISLSGAVTFKNAPKLAQVAQNVPLDRLLVETDCPYMAPVPCAASGTSPLLWLIPRKRWLNCAAWTRRNSPSPPMRTASDCLASEKKRKDWKFCSGMRMAQLACALGFRQICVARF